MPAWAKMAESASLVAAMSSISALDLRKLGAVAQNVDIALGELAEAALLRLVGAPDAADLQRLEGARQLRCVRGIIARERHREVIAQAGIGKVRAAALDHLLEIAAALEDLEDELLIFAALLVGEVFDVLHGGRFDLGEAVAAVGIANEPHDALPKLHIAGELIAHALDGRFDKVHWNHSLSIFSRVTL